MKTRLFVVAACAAFAGAYSFVAAAKDPVDWVNTGIGTISHLLVPTFPTVQRPNGMLRLLAPNHDFVTDRVEGFVLQNPGHRQGGCFTLRPGPAPMTYDQQHIQPYRSDVFIDSADVTVSFAPARHAAIAEIVFEGTGSQELKLGTRDNGRLTVTGQTVAGHDHFGGVKVYLYGEFDGPVSVIQGGRDSRDVRLGVEAPRTLHFRYAVSYISAEQAVKNLRAEISHWSLAQVANEARAEWNETLGQVRVEGADDNRMTVFYTALWRCYERMVNITEDGHYLGYDRQVHATGGVDHYTDDWIWDTFRAHHPLMVLLRPNEEAAKLQSYVRMAQENREGWVPTFPGLAGDHHCMNGFHVPAAFLDAWRKGVRGFDLAAAYRVCDKTMREASKIPWYRGSKVAGYDDFYDQHGWVPALHPGERETLPMVSRWEQRQAVAVTQAFSYDAWCMGELAKTLKRPEAEIAAYVKESGNFRQLWRKDTGFFHPKDKDGKWIEPFDYRFSGGIGARAYYDENNAWTYIWDVQHALPELVELFGGPNPFVAQLERMFNEGLGCAKFDWPSKMPDSSGMVGQFVMGNEPSFHVPYLFNFAGQPWKTQKLVRKLLDAWFRNDLMGVPGDEDGGGMSAFVVFSSLGFYPVTPGRPDYAWGSPCFTRATIRLANGKDFVLEAPKASADAKYIQRVTVNGRPQEGTWISHDVISAGAHVLVEMGTRPNKTWGVSR